MNAKNPKSIPRRNPLNRWVRFAGIAFLLILVAGFVGFGLIAFNAKNTSLDEKLLHAVLGKTFYSDVYVMFPNGGVEKLSPTENGIYYQAHISPDGTKVVFYGNTSGSPRIWLTDLQGGRTRPLTPEGVSARHPVFSRDGRMIAFASDIGHVQDRERIELMHGDGRPSKDYVLNIYVMDTEGQHLRRITTGLFQDQRPAFSPDGKTIAFVSNRGGEERLWMVSTDEPGDPIPLQTDGFGYKPCFSPGGEDLYFFTRNSGSDQLAVMNVRDRKIRLLNDFGNGNDHGPFAGYDGRSLLMHSNRGGKWEIWEVSLNEQMPRKVNVPFNEALHATKSENGIIAFDVPEISETRKFLSRMQTNIRKVKKSFN